MSVAFNAALSGIASGLIGAVIAGMSPPGRELINKIADKFKSEPYYGQHRIGFQRHRAERLNRLRKIRLAELANKAWIELKPTAQVVDQGLRLRQWV